MISLTLDGYHAQLALGTDSWFRVSNFSSKKTWNSDRRGEICPWQDFRYQGQSGVGGFPCSFVGHLKQVWEHNEIPAGISCINRATEGWEKKLYVAVPNIFETLFYIHPHSNSLLNTYTCLSMNSYFQSNKNKRPFSFIILKSHCSSK